MRTKHLVASALTALGALPAAAQVGVGTTTPHPSAVLDVTAARPATAPGGLLAPRLTAAQRAAIASPAQGLLVYQTDGLTPGLWHFDGGQWKPFSQATELELPYQGTGPATAPGDIFTIVKNSTSTNLAAVTGQASNQGVGVRGSSINGTGVVGEAGMAHPGFGSGAGVTGLSGDGPGLFGASLRGDAVRGEKYASHTGRSAFFTNTNAANDSATVRMETNGSGTALAVTGTSATSARPAVFVRNLADPAGGGANALRAEASGRTQPVALKGLATDTARANAGFGVQGVSFNSGAGVMGQALRNGPQYYQPGTGVSAYSERGNGLWAYSTDKAGSSLVAIKRTSSAALARGRVAFLANYEATNDSSALRIENRGEGNALVSVQMATTGNKAAVVGRTVSTSGGAGVEGHSVLYGVVGISELPPAGVPTGGLGYGVLGEGYRTNGGVAGYTESGVGVYGRAQSNGVGGLFDSFGGTAGVFGTNSGLGGAVQADLFEDDNDYARLQFRNSYTTNFWHLAGYTNTAPASARFNLYYNNLNGGSGGNVLSVGGDGISTFGTTGTVFTSGAGLGSIVDVGQNRSAVVGRVTGTANNAYSGVRGENPAGFGVSGYTTSGTGVYGDNAGSNTSGHAGYFNGRVTITGNLSKGGGSFKIDHPLDPENKYLYHSFVESPDMMNVYNGNATFDARGEAEVILPDWFEALNRDFRYQLTSLGAFQPVFVQEEMKNNRFRIAGGQPGGRVSWQVTGIRHDRYAEQNRIPVEEAKEPTNRGRYLHPTAFGQPASRTVRAVPGTGAEAAAPATERLKVAAVVAGPVPTLAKPLALPAPAPLRTAPKASTLDPDRRAPRSLGHP